MAEIDIPALPAAFVDVNETGILMAGNHETSKLWMIWRHHAEAAGRVEVLASGIGDRVRIVCDTRENAEWLAGHLVELGIAQGHVSANRPLPAKVRSGRKSVIS